MFSFTLVFVAFPAFAAPEVCNGFDDDGDSFVDEGPVASFADLDFDGFGDPASLTWSLSCAVVPAGRVADDGDCDDGRTIGIEVLNGLDDDCNGTIDDGVTPGACFVEEDLDSRFLLCDTAVSFTAATNNCASYGYTLANSSTQDELDLIAGYILEGAWAWLGVWDPQSNNSWVYIDDGSPAPSSGPPWASDQPNDGTHDCVRIDNTARWHDFSCATPSVYVCKIDCPLSNWYLDFDGDGLGNPSDVIASCNAVVGRVRNAGDCDDADDAISTTIWYANLDGDGFGTTDVGLGCDPLPMSSPFPGDCDDGDPAIHPEAVEVCGGVDENCNGLWDDDDPAVDTTTFQDFFLDDDGDGFGVDTDIVRACAAPAGYAAVDGDCVDTDELIFPGAIERCNNIDDNCEGTADEYVDQLWYFDADEDGYGDPDTEELTCDPAAGYVLTGGDCDDTEPAIHPGAEEIPDDGIDQDCDGEEAGTPPTRRGPDEEEKDTPPETVGCGCMPLAPLPSPGFLAGLVGALVIARRRR